MADVNSVALAGGGRVDWYQASGTLHVQQYDASGAAVGAELTTIAANIDPQVEALSSGGYVVLSGQATAHYPYFEIRVFDSHGAQVAGFSESTYTRIAASPEGGFIVLSGHAATHPAPGGGSYQYDAPTIQTYSDAGVATHAPVDLAGEHAQVSVTSGGDYMVSWETLDGEARRLVIDGANPGPALDAVGHAPTLAIADAGSHAEGNSGVTDVTFTVTRSGDPSAAAAVDYYVWGDQTDGSDFSGATSGTAYFGAGETTATVHIGVAGDTANEADETFHVSLANARGATITIDTGAAVILNDDGQSSGGGGTGGGDTGGGSTGSGSTFAISGPGSVHEGNSGATDFAFTVTRSGDLSTAGAVDYYMWGSDTDASDFSGATGGTAYFAEGQSTAVVHINVNGDTTNEADESFNISLANGRGGTITTDTATAVILNDEGQSSGGGDTGGGGSTGGTTFSINGPGALDESSSGHVNNFNFAITRSGDVSGAGAVDYWVWGDQTDGSDFSGPTAGTAYFEAGQSTATVSIGVMGDTAQEGDEAFQVSIANARGGTIAVDTGGAIIRNDDTPSSGGGDTGGDGGGSNTAMITISGGGDVTEGDSGLLDVAFTVTRAGASAGDAAVDWWVWGDTDGSDFSGATGGTVYFADGETSKVIHLSVAGDTTAEADEAFHLSLANARGAALGATTTADAVILHNDGWLVA